MEKQMKNFIPFIVLLLLFTGCSNNGSIVRGKVTLSDGSPLTFGEVRFTTETFVGSGFIGKDGSYRISGATPSQGIPNDNYQVSVIATKLEGADENSPIDAKYAKRETSGLTCEVKGNTTFNIELEKGTK
jgi:hypothetical protein